MFTGADVLSRAESILEGGELPASHAEHGPFCLWCAIAMAKGQLDKEHESGVSVSELFEDVALGVIMERSADWPLVQARIALKEWNSADPHSMKQETAIEALRKARTHLQAETTASSSPT